MMHDYRKSRFYQEARQDGVEEGEAKMLRENIHRMASNGFDAKQISELLAVDIKTVRKILKAASSI